MLWFFLLLTQAGREPSRLVAACRGWTRCAALGRAVSRQWLARGIVTRMG
jgi:hypothetical protein